MPKGKDKDKYDNRPLETFHYVTLERSIGNRECVKKQIVWVFWNNKHISELCEKWVYGNREYGYTRFEELRTCSGEVIYTRKDKAITTKREINIFLDIDELNVFRKKQINSLEEYSRQKYQSNNTNK